MDNQDLNEKKPEEYSLDEILSEAFWEGLSLQTPDEPEEASEELPESFFTLEDETLDAAPASEEPPVQEPPVQEPPVPQEEPSGEGDFPVDAELEALLSSQKEEPFVKIKKKRQKPTWQRSLLLYLHDLVYLMAAVIVIFLLLFRVVVVSGRSMNNTLYDGDYLLLVSNVFYQNPRQGDVIVASKDSFKDGTPIVKRVIATEGQWVDIDFELGIVYVGNDLESLKALDEPYVLGSTTLQEGTSFPLQVEQGHIFVMGDNRGDSMDSRDPRIGQIDVREVMGKVVFLFFPGTNFGQYPLDFGRVGVVS